MPTESGDPDAYWVHLSVQDPDHVNWLKATSGLSQEVVNALLAPKVRPRLAATPNSLLVILRVADTLEASEHEELRSLRIYTEGKRIISTSLYPLPTVQSIRQSWAGKEGNTCDLFLELVVKSIRGLEPILEELDEQADLLEKQVLDVGQDPEERDVAVLALDSLQLRRYLAPQKEVLSRLFRIDSETFDETHRQRLKSSFDLVCRQLDEVDVLRDRVRIIREQISSHIAEQSNHRLYIFSVIALIFAPLGFLTGLLGVNLGGIPGADHPAAFSSFCAVLLALATVMMIIIKKAKWI